MILQEASTLENPKFKSLYRQLTLRYHPDNKKTGDLEMVKKLNAAAAEGDRSFGELLKQLEKKGVLQRVGAKQEEPKKEEPKKQEIDAFVLNRLKKWLIEKAEQEKGYTIEIDLVFHNAKPYFFIKISKRIGFKKYSKDFNILASNIINYPNITLEQAATVVIKTAIKIFESGIS